MIDEIDGATVIEYTIDGDFGFVKYEDGHRETITVLAICSYDHKEYYLFACDSLFNVLGDTVHRSKDEASIFANEYYGKEEIHWMKINE